MVTSFSAVRGGFSLVGSVTSRNSCNGVFGRRHSCLSWHQLQPGPSSQAFKTKEGWNSGMPWQSRGLVLRAMGETLWELQVLLVKNLREEAAPSKHKGWAFTNSIQPLMAMSIPRLEWLGSKGHIYTILTSTYTFSSRVTHSRVWVVRAKKSLLPTCAPLRCILWHSVILMTDVKTSICDSTRADLFSEPE